MWKEYKKCEEDSEKKGRWGEGENWMGKRHLQKMYHQFLLLGGPRMKRFEESLRDWLVRRLSLVLKWKKMRQCVFDLLA